MGECNDGVRSAADISSGGCRCAPSGLGEQSELVNVSSRRDSIGQDSDAIRRTAAERVHLTSAATTGMGGMF